MEYLNFDLEIQPASSGVHPVVARSGTSVGRAMMRFPFDAPALENVLLRVQNALLRSVALRRQVLSPEAQVVQDFGERLFSALMTGEVLQLYDASGALANQQNKGLRVRLQVQAPELAALPWEFLYDPRQGEYLCFLPNRPVVRYLDAPQPTHPLTVDPPLRVLAMIASPSDQARLDVEHERQRLKDALAPLEQRGLLKLRWVQGQTWRDLQQALLQREWHVFHFIGHGGFDSRIEEGVLALADEQGKTRLLSATDLGRMLAQRTSLRLVVLNACQGAAANKTDLFSSTAATLSRRGLPAVLAMQYEITDQAAIEFTRGFYDALSAGLPVDASLTQARTSISLGLNRTLEWVTPVLYMRAPDGMLFHVPSHSTILPPPAERPQPAPPATGSAAGPGRPPAAPPLGSVPPTWHPPQQPAGIQGYAGPASRPPAPAYTPASAPPLVSVPPPKKRRGVGLCLTLSIIAVLLVATLGGLAFFVLPSIFSGFHFPGLPNPFGDSSQFHLSRTSLSSADCDQFGNQLNCQITLTNDDASQQLNWRVTSTDPSITFQPDSSGFVPGGGSWPVTIIVPTSSCPGSATFTFTGGSKTISVSWNCS